MELEKSFFSLSLQTLEQFTHKTLRNNIMRNFVVFKRALIRHVSLLC